VNLEVTEKVEKVLLGMRDGSLLADLKNEMEKAKSAKLTREELSRVKKPSADSTKSAEMAKKTRWSTNVSKEETSAQSTAVQPPPDRPSRATKRPSSFDQP